MSRSDLCQDPCGRPGCSNPARPGGGYCSSTCLEARPKREARCVCSDCRQPYERHPNSRGTRCPKCQRAAKARYNAEWNAAHKRVRS